MSVVVLLFGPHAAAVGADRVSVDLGGTHTCDALVGALRVQHPALGGLMGGARIAVNGRFAAPETVVARGDELALIGLVGGG
ncbi:MAG: MoaD/ThiS family protein [Phycisphaerales bacterium]